MNNMQMAHEYALEMLKETLPTGSLYGDDANRVAMSMVELAWMLADAMQAEADKRNKAEAEQKRKEVREILNDANTFIEREGQHFDDVYGCEVDWRVAPEWAKYWAIREGSDTALWCINKPTVTGDCFLSHGGCGPAPTFGFTGSHIVERPQ